MDINNYTAYFHDGDLDINHSEDTIILTMASAETDQQDCDIELSQESPYPNLIGKLHCEHVKEIFINDKSFKGRLEKKYYEAGIFRFKIQKNKVLLSIKWSNYSPQYQELDLSTIRIEAGKIYWENIPTLPLD
ncbi:MAG: hypothetical protein ACRCSV_01070 [Chlamydiales bacterium]